MDDTSRRLVARAPSCFREPPAKIHLFDVHEVLTVETTYRVKSAAANKEARASYPVHDPASRPGTVRLSIATAIRVLREQCTQDRLNTRTTDGWESSPRRLEISSRGYECRTDESERRVLCEAVDHRAESPRLQYEIGIANEEQFSGYSLGPVVHTTPEAEVPTRVEHPHTSVLRREALERVVSRSVVHYHDLPDALTLQARDTLAERRAGVVVHYDGGNFVDR
jgi:hypothetical protein